MRGGGGNSKPRSPKLQLPSSSQASRRSALTEGFRPNLRVLGLGVRFLGMSGLGFWVLLGECDLPTLCRCRREGRCRTRSPASMRPVFPKSETLIPGGGGLRGFGFPSKSNLYLFKVCFPSCGLNNPPGPEGAAPEKPNPRCSPRPTTPLSPGGTCSSLAQLVSLGILWPLYLEALST